jgi:hypothetical protein
MKLTLWIHQKHEMAELREGRSHSLFLGNFWDFHAGCGGTKLTFADGTTVDFREEWTDSIRRPRPMARMVADKMGAELTVRYRKTPFDC